jgi:hypothetical protein
MIKVFISIGSMETEIALPAVEDDEEEVCHFLLLLSTVLIQEKREALAAH